MDNNDTKKAERIKTQRRAHLPKLPFHNIAISLSGGGFRATSIHMGVLSYLSSKTYRGTTLLERVRVLSTVSAGTFAGVKYITTLKKGGTIEDCYKSLYMFMVGKNLVGDALEYMADDSNWTKGRQRSLINAFASMYYKEFESENFGILWEENPPIHLKEITFNATEFSFALPFHFRKAERPHAKVGSIAHEYIGNKKIHIPVEVAKEIRLADIIAASSCFPFGFEPINFPDDFIYEGAVKLKDKFLLPHNVFDGDKIEYPIGLMDGGIDDNQGVDAILTAEERMKNYTDELKEFRSDDKKAVDLYILSDGTNPNMEGYLPSNKDKLKIIGKWNFNSLSRFGITSSVIGVMAIVMACLCTSKTSIISLTMFGTLGLMIAFVLLVFSMGFVGLTKRMGVPDFFVERLFHVDKLKFRDLNNLLVNRRKSVSKMVSKVFIKHMRWFSHERVYGDPVWRPRLIMNAVFELTEVEVEKRKKKYPYFTNELTEPGKEIMSVAAKALKMGTTLWFTPEELEGDKNMVNTVIACGHFTICFNLLEYFEKYIYNKTYQNDYERYSDEIKKELKELHAALLEDWKKFKVDPYWMVNEWNEKLIPKES
ncbi:MAG: patatin-like phospholipase family protein [Bacteroidetes bacterium]|nr:patatin-like phospholipase family protein [Bacteroidota bacterium]